MNGLGRGGRVSYPPPLPQHTLPGYSKLNLDSKIAERNTYTPLPPPQSMFKAKIFSHRNLRGSR